MLASDHPSAIQSNPIENWSHRYNTLATSLPAVQSHTFDSNTRQSRKSTTVKHIYQIVFDSIHGLPVPNSVIQKASKLNASVKCRLSMSLFDLETSTFVGKTWHSPNAIPIIKNLSYKHHGSDSSSMSDSNSDTNSVASQQDQLNDAQLIGNKLNLQFKKQCVYFHTQSTSRYMVAVFEVTFEVQEDEIVHNSNPQFQLSSGWSIMYLFNSKRGGIDLETKEDNKLQTEDLKIVPMFTGSPRTLMFISSTLADAITGYPGMTTLPGTALRYYLIPRHDIKAKHCVWKENSFIGVDDTIPGLKKIGIRGLELAGSHKILISNIKLSVPLSIEEYDQNFLEQYRDAYFENHLESVYLDDNHNLPSPNILERRLHVGFHNGYEFLSPPIIISLSNDDDAIQEFQFPGDVSLDYYQTESNVSLVFMFEYKISINVNAPEEQKGPISQLLEKFARTKPRNKVLELNDTMETFAVLGWSVITLENDNCAIENLTLDGGNIPNPFQSFVFNSYAKNLDEILDPLKLSFDVRTPHSKIEKVPELPTKFLNSELLESPQAFTPDIIKKIESHHTLSETIPITKSKSIEFNEPGKSDALDEQEQEELVEVKPTVQETSFTPIEIPKLVEKKGQLSRIQKARLLDAGYEQFYDDRGLLPTHLKLENINNLQNDLSIEEKDANHNEFTFQFLGITFNEEYSKRSKGIFPDSVTFSFQFYTFPNFATERLKVYNGSLPPTYETQSLHQRIQSLPTHQRQWSHFSNHSAPQNETNPPDLEWPGILYKHENDGRPAYDRKPGLSIQFNVNSNQEKKSSTIRYGNVSFPFYLDQKQLFIDIWDGDTLHHLGMACLDLKSMLRQGADAVMMDQDVDIIWNYYPDDTHDHVRTSSHSSQMSRTIVSPKESSLRSLKVGILHMKTINIGRTKCKSDIQSPVDHGSERIIINDYHEEVKYRLNMTHDPKKMVDIEPDLRQVLKKNLEERQELRKAMNNDKPKIESIQSQSDEERRKKIALQFLQKENLGLSPEWNIFDHVDDLPNSFAYKQSREERERDMQTIEIFRERRKKNAIETALRNQITTKHVIDVSFGQGYFFEFVLENPYNNDHNFEILWDNSELRIIQDENEWLYHRRVHQIMTGVEKNMFSNKLSDGRYSIFLEANEKIRIPFLYQTFKSQSVSSHPSTGIQDMCHSKINHSLQVSFLNSKKIPVAFLEIILHSKNFYIDRSIQMYHCENELVRKTIRFPKHSYPTMSYESGVCQINSDLTTNQLYLRCSHPNVVCSITEKMNDSNYNELNFKYRVSNAPDHTNLYFVFFSDKYCTMVNEIWKLTVHTIFRLDVNCIYGQTNSASLVLRGRTITRKVICYTSVQNQIIPEHSGPIILPANSLIEIPLMIHPASEFDAPVIANVVDIETKELISSWMIVSHISMPSITKVFDITLKKDKQSNKKLLYTNPFLHSKFLTMRTDSPHLLQFKSNVMDLKGGESQYIGLKFAPSTNNTNTDILVFLNNDQDKVEECLCIHVQYIE
ncbi:hypothetical protein BC833DRAFT_579101 [Globomyces pollinis-pini]|nr:hypothetical protein BC833DRAFT_579101 [Globomyces pollinis-pini]